MTTNIEEENWSLVIETFRYAFLNAWATNTNYLRYSFEFTVVMIGGAIFNRVEKNLMDIV